MKHAINLVLLIGVFACSQQQTKEQQTKGAVAPQSFREVSFTESDSLILSRGLSYTVLFSEGDEVLNHNNETAPAKGVHDMIVFLPEQNSSTKGQLFVSHETSTLSDVLGHGGGATIMSIENKSGWKVISDKYNIDFSGVGYTLQNCGGKTTPKGTILMAEETYPTTNEELIGEVIKEGETPVDTLKDNFGWMVEVDPKTKKATQKITAMGRYVHEDALFLPDNKTVILTNDDSPAVLFKFVSDSENDYSKGTLFAYSETGEHWITLPGDINSLKNINQVAIGKGATMFVRHEWVVQVGDDLYIAETGHDNMDWKNAITQGGVPASYFEKQLVQPGIYADSYGRILKLNTKTWELSVLINGGTFGQGECFSNPDCISHFTYGGRKYLIMSEDIIGASGGRVSEKAFANGEKHNEVYLLDLSIVNPQLTDLIRFASAPKGSETTGLYFTPDEKTLFMAIQHPDAGNKEPFNKTSVIAITGF